MKQLSKLFFLLVCVHGHFNPMRNSILHMEKFMDKSDVLKFKSISKENEDLIFIESLSKQTSLVRFKRTGTMQVLDGIVDSRAPNYQDIIDAIYNDKTRAGLLMMPELSELNINKSCGLEFCPYSIFELAVAMNNFELVAELLKLQKPNLWNKWGSTILHLVPVEHDAHKTMKLLLENIPENDLKGIINACDKPQARENRETVLHKFAAFGNFEVCEILVQAGADIFAHQNGHSENAIDLVKKYAKKVDDPSEKRKFSKLKKFFEGIQEYFLHFPDAHAPIDIDELALREPNVATKAQNFFARQRSFFLKFLSFLSLVFALIFAILIQNIGNQNSIIIQNNGNQSPFRLLER